MTNQTIPADHKNVQHYFEQCADRFDGFYHDEKRNFYQQLAHKVFRKPGLARRFQKTVEAVSPIEEKKILDVGCGSGIYSIYLSKLGAKVSGLDFASTMIELAKKNALEQKCQPRFILGNFLDSKFSEQFDHTLFIGVFDYVSPSNVGEYLKKAGDLTTQSIVATFPKRFTAQMPIRYFWLKNQNCPVYFYAKKMIIDCANEAGFSAQFFNCGPIWTVVFKKSGK